jgi:hypothetical protein
MKIHQKAGPNPHSKRHELAELLHRLIDHCGNRRHLASVLRQGRKTRILTPVWESSGESRLGGCNMSKLALNDAAPRLFDEAVERAQTEMPEWYIPSAKGC